MYFLAIEKNHNEQILDGSLILQVKEVLLKHCCILVDPMGKKDTVQQSKKVPIVHPIIKFSRNHFKYNSAFTDGKIKTLEERQRAYKDAPNFNFDALVRFVLYICIIKHIFKIFILKMSCCLTLIFLLIDIYCNNFKNFLNSPILFSAIFFSF